MDMTSEDAYCGSAIWSKSVQSVVRPPMRFATLAATRLAPNVATYE